MKTKTIVFLLALLLIVLAGCNNAPPNEDKPQPFSFSESVQTPLNPKRLRERKARRLKQRLKPYRNQSRKSRKKQRKRIRSAPNSLRLILITGRRHSPPNNPIKRIRPNIPYPHRSRIFQRKAKRLRRLKRKKHRAKLKLTLTLTTGFPLQKVTLRAWGFC